MSGSILLADHARQGWLSFAEPVAVVAAWDVGRVGARLAELESAVAAGLWAAGFISYEAAPAFDRALRVPPPDPHLPLLWFGLYRAPRFLPDLPPAHDAGFTLGAWEPSVSLPAYRQAIAHIKDRIAAGDTYQVNYTFRLRAPFHGDPWNLFLRLWEAQHAPYATYIETDDFAVCSASPELFFRLDGDHIQAQPMKGTARRGRTLAEDEDQARWLARSEKNRAENVMIVDMIRNDLGRIAAPGTVSVDRLFNVTRYPTLWQMTSTVSARTGAGLVDIMSALFPCASVTGAPKVSTMGIITALESVPREFYTGAIGYWAPNRRSVFNVAIRTVLIDRRRQTAAYGVGSGIVWDSDADDEYRECQTKARILTVAPPDFSLLESLLWEPERGYFLLDRHLQRIADSAAYFGIPFDLPAVQVQLAGFATGLPQQPHKVRLLVDQRGAATVEAAVISAPAAPLKLAVALAAHPVDSADPFLFHKTTRRAVYEQALSGRPGFDDVLLWNEQGELTESTRANLVLRLDGQLRTPPVTSGLLPGTFRAELLAQGVLQEQTLSLTDLDRAEALYLINSVRRWMVATLPHP